MNLQQYRAELEDRKSRRNLLQQQLEQCGEKIAEKQEYLENLKKSRWVISEVARKTQAHVTQYIESLGTMAIRSVFDRDFRLIADFEIKRNKSECRLLVQEGDQEPFVPKEEMGGGIIDVLSFALRVILWSMQKPKSRNVLIVDEPLKFVGKGELLEKAGEMVRKISHKLNFQLVLVTHADELSAIGDRNWEVKHNGVCSEVTEL